MCSNCFVSCSSQIYHPPIACQITLVLLGIQMAEGGTAEKFPDEWDLKFLGTSILNQLSLGISPDFLIERYMPLFFFFFFYYLFYYNYCIYIFIYEGLNVLLESRTCLKEFLVTLFSGFFFPSSPEKLF